ncbi:MAG: hypothetical protein QJQ54_02315 [Mollicutes bacterium]|nr:MAG: hypothetical protein QJQ54_02315 [Mollicutes bacterium]
MLNTVSLVGFLSSELKEFLNSHKKEDFKFYTFSLTVNKPYLISKTPNESDQIFIKTYDFNIKKYIHILKKNSILGIEGRIINENNNIIIFADNLIFLGHKK